MTKAKIAEKLNEIIKGIYDGTFKEIEKIIEVLEELSVKIENDC